MELFIFVCIGVLAIGIPVFIFSRMFIDGREFNKWLNLKHRGDIEALFEKLKSASDERNRRNKCG